MRKKSFAEHASQGTFRRDRHAKKEPAYPSGASCPSYLKGAARKEWRRVAPLLFEQGVLQEIDQSLLGTYCQMFAHWRASEDDITKNGLVIMIESTTRTGRTQKPIPNPAVRNAVVFHRAMMQTAVKFGINPLDRPRVSVPVTPEYLGTTVATPYDQNEDIDNYAVEVPDEN